MKKSVSDALAIWPPSALPAPGAKERALSDNSFGKDERAALWSKEAWGLHGCGRDGVECTYPLPRLGGPFDTVTKYLDAWAEAAKPPNVELLREVSVRQAGGKTDSKDAEEKISWLETSFFAFPSGSKELDSR